MRKQLVKFSNRNLASRTAIIYVVISAIYIFTSDRLVSSLFSDIRTITVVNTYKGWGFVCVTGFLIYFLIKNPLKKLRQSKEKYSKIVNTASEGILVVDKDMKISFANARIFEIMLYQSTEMLGKPLDQFIQKSELPDHYEKIANYRIGNFDRYERCFIRKDGSPVCMLVSSTVIHDEEGNFSGFYAMLTDISELKKTQEDLVKHQEVLRKQNDRYALVNEELAESNSRIQKMYEDLKIAKEKAEESDKLKTAFLANMSHEIRTPLNGIVGFTNLMLDDDLTKEKKERFGDIILKSSEQLLSIINDILDLSKIETGQMNINIDSFNLNGLIDDAYSFFITRATEKGLLFKVNKTLDNQDALILTDRSKLNQVLTNLISNALKFTHNGSITVSYKREGSDLLFSVKDTGIGIEIKDHENIFKRFIQAQYSSKRLYGGTGLGLSISKALVEMMGGKIWVQSELGYGSTFYFTIPYNSIKQTIIPKEVIKEPILDLQKTTVLIVDDEEFNYVYLNELLVAINATVLYAENGYKAIDLCKEHQEIKLVFMDIKLPDIDGYKATKIIKEMRPELTIIAQTAYTLGVDNNDVFEAGCSGYLTKPITKKDLLDILEKSIMLSSKKIDKAQE